MDAILKQKLLRSCEIFYNFLTMENKEQFNNYKKSLSKTNMPTMLRDSYNLDGIINTKLNPDNEINTKNIYESINTKEILLKKLCEAFKNLENDMGLVANSLRQVSHFCGLLQNYSESYQDVFS